MKTLQLIVLLAFVFGNCVFANNDKFFVKEQSSWVENISYNDKDGVGVTDTEDGAIYYLSDYQSNVVTLEKYFRSVTKIINEVGIKNCANIWVNYDPNYQELIFHTIKIHRRGKVYSRLDKSKFKIIQNESELESNVFNGSFSAGYFIEDVQVGDIVEYSYTIVGENPIFKGNYFDLFYLQFSSPVKKIIAQQDSQRMIKLIINSSILCKNPCVLKRMGWLFLHGRMKMFRKLFQIVSCQVGTLLIRECNSVPSILGQNLLTGEKNSIQLITSEVGN